MNILTFDVEDWYNCDFISEGSDWNKHEVRIYAGVERILTELESRKITATFFCLGWLAENHPQVIKAIHNSGHEIGCHSYQHQLSSRFSNSQFREDTHKAQSLLENVIGKKVNTFRAPGFSITKNNLWAFEVLVELGFDFDCSIFSGVHDYGGYKDYGKSEPAVISINGVEIKEFPINTHSIFTKNIVFSGGGYFRLFPYPLIKKWAKEADYLMTYFHPRDFDPEQPVIKSLPLSRKFKSYYGLKQAFPKFQKLLDDFEFVNLEAADKMIDWEHVRRIYL